MFFAISFEQIANVANKLQNSNVNNNYMIRMQVCKQNLIGNLLTSVAIY